MNKLEIFENKIKEEIAKEQNFQFRFGRLIEHQDDIYHKNAPNNMKCPSCGTNLKKEYGKVFDGITTHDVSISICNSCGYQYADWGHPIKEVINYIIRTIGGIYGIFRRR